MKPTTVLFSLFSFFCIISICNAASKVKPEGPVQTFVIDGGAASTIAVKLEGDAIITSCELKFDTSVATVEKKKDYILAPTLIAQMSAKYGCLEYKQDIFTYNVCLEGEISQSADNNEKYSLGKYEELKQGHAFNQVYTKGTFCEVAHIERKSLVEFTCADSVSVITISENSKCQYRVTIGTPDVCGHPQFVITSTKAESWVLEISETDEGTVMCQAYNNGYDNIGTITFSIFDLSLSTGSYDLIKQTVRSKNRQLVDNAVIEETVSPARVSITKPQQIDYAKIVAE